MGARAWCFTWNNYPACSTDMLNKIPDISALVVGQEVGESGTPHLQGYVSFTKVMYLPGLKKLVGQELHWEVCRDRAASKKYCRKDGKMLIDIDNEPGQGHRRDLDEGIRIASEGGLSALKRSRPDLLIKYASGFRLFCSIGNPSIDRPQLRVVVYAGTTGIGKTHAASTQISGGNGFRMCLPNDPKSPIWFDGLSDTHNVLVLEDFRGQIPYRALLGILDVAAISLPCKGGMVQAHYTKVIITTSAMGDMYGIWYPLESDYSELKRRIHGIYLRPPWDLGVLEY